MVFDSWWFCVVTVKELLCECRQVVPLVLLVSVCAVVLAVTAVVVVVGLAFVLVVIAVVAFATSRYHRQSPCFQ